MMKQVYSHAGSFFLYMFIPLAFVQHSEGQDSQIESRAMEIVSNLKGQYEGHQGELLALKKQTVIGKRTYDADANQEPAVLQFWISEDGQFRRFCSRFAISPGPPRLMQINELVQVPDQLMLATDDIDDGDGAPEPSDSAPVGKFIEAPESYVEFMSPGAALAAFGVSDLDGLPIDAIINRSNAIRTIDRDADRPNIVTLRADVPSFGIYSFVCDLDSNQLKELHVVKKRRTDTWLPGFRFPRLRMGELDNNSGSQADSIDIAISDIQYDRAKGDGRIVSFAITQTRTVGNRQPIDRDQVRIEKVKPFSHKSDGQIEFAVVSVAEGARVNVIGQEGLAFQFIDGRIERVLDGTTVSEMNGIRFRKTASRWPWYLAGIVAISVVGGVYYYAKLKQQ